LNVFLKPLPPTDDEDSPPLTPSELPQYFWNKVAESRKASSSTSSTTSTKGLPPPRIPPSGTPVKHERQIPPFGTPIKLKRSTIKLNPDSKTTIKLNLDSKTNVKPDPDEESTSSGCEFNGESGEGDQGIEDPLQIAHLKPQFSEFTHIFPSFPKTHKNGYIYIIELSNEILNEKALVDLRDALQYSLTGGGGARVLENVKFFAIDGEKVPMKIHYRVCAGIFKKYVFV
jgi:hypothetical protein